MSFTLAVSIRKNKPPRNIGIIAAGGVRSGALNKNGKVFSWGFNGQGGGGYNSLTNVSTPVAIAGLNKTFCKIDYSGSLTGYGIDKNGRAWAWGGNAFGQLGDNSTVSKLTPVSVLGAVKTFCEIITGGGGNGTYALALDKYGRAWGWGANSTGNLGDNTITQRNTPVSVLGAVKTFCYINSGGGNGSDFFGVALDKYGRAWAWGSSANGQLGDNSAVSKRTPVSVQGAVKTFCWINAGGAHVLALDKNGRLWAWGINTNGQLGDNSVTQRNTPVSVLGAVKTFCQIVAGKNPFQGFSCAIDKYGRLWAWGYNSDGAVGDNTTTQRNTPVSVVGVVKTFCRISAGGSHVVALDKNGNTWAWGFNNSGQLGHNTVSGKLTPTRVCNI